MKRKTLLPKGTPRQGELIVLADWKARNRPEEITIPLPAGAMDDDNFEAISSTFSFPLLGVRVGDVFVSCLTDDIEAGDYITTFKPGCTYIDKLVKMTKTRIHIMGPEGSVWAYRSEILIKGRIVGVLRKGRYIETREPLRPVHPIATLCQFQRKV